MEITKRCSACGTDLPLAEYAKSKQGRLGLKSECRKCTNKRASAYRESNREKLREYKRKWRETSSRAINEKHCPSQKPELVRERSSRWQKDNPDKAYVRNSKRRADKLAATVKWANKDAIALLFRKAKQMTLDTGTAWHVDHIVPLRSPIVCGLHCEANLQVITGEENCSKKNRYWPDMP